MNDSSDAKSGAVRLGTQSAADDVSWLPEPSLYYRIVKRAIDLVGSVIATVLLSPLWILIALSIKLTSEGPIFFPQTRLGYRAKEFTFLKFRSMYVGSNTRISKQYVENLIGGRYGKIGESPISKIAADPRITPIGRLLMKTSLDETPQLINVLLGQMSLVGPRPAIPYEWEQYAPWQKERLSCRPGVTGYGQITGGHGVSFDEMVRLDIEYIRRRSLFVDFKILFLTPWIVLSGKSSF